MSIKTLSVLIVGCGNIAGIFDQERAGSNPPYTHAGAYSCDERFSLSACVEPDYDRRIKFMDFWGVSVGFSRIDDILASGQLYDVVSICSPSDCHSYDLEIALRLKPKLIFCEKPLTTSLIDAENFVEKCRDNKILLAVNYTRRFDPDISKLYADMQAGKWGELRSVVGLYNKGLLNNGSHMIDILQFLIGPIEIVNVGKRVDDFFRNDPSVPVLLENFQGVPVYIGCGHAADYSIFEIQFIFSRGVLTMENGGLFWRDQRIVDSNAFKGFRELDQGVRHEGEYPYAMMRAIDNIYRAITDSKPLLSTGDSALFSQQMCEKIKQMVIEQ